MNRNLARSITGYLAVLGGPAGQLAKLASSGRAAWPGGLEWLDQTGLALQLWAQLNADGAQRAVPPGVAARMPRTEEEPRRMPTR